MIVKKPWGHEYIAYENDVVAVWHLVIKPGCSTSFHCHPHKKTGLLVLQGKAILSFMSDEQVLNELDKRIIRIGVFHATRNIGVDDLHLIELETPKDKDDILRLEDNYGRAGQPYEGPEHYKFEKGQIDLSKGHAHFGKMSLEILTIKDEKDLFKVRDCKLIILKGCIHLNGVEAAGVGDLIDDRTFNRLRDKFQVKYPVQILKIYDSTKRI